MKPVILLLSLIFQLVGFSADAKFYSSLNGVPGNDQPVTAFSIAEEEPSVLKRKLTISHKVTKLRLTRSFAAVSDLSADPETFCSLDGCSAKGYASPFFQPLVRLLLFPKHYFW